MQETLITPMKRTSAQLRYADLVLFFSLPLSSKVVEYMQSTSYRRARESSETKAKRDLVYHDGEAESPAEYQDAAATENITNE